MAPGTLLIRADADVAMGTGHVMRCLALAEEWCVQGGEVVFASADLVPTMADRLVSAGMRLQPIMASAATAGDAAETRALARRCGARWIVLDGYHFPATFAGWLGADGQRVLMLDDNGGAECYQADLLVNQNLHANATMYRQQADGISLLLGNRYVLLRQEFCRHPQRLAKPVGSHRVLVTLGGSDPANVTGWILAVLTQRLAWDVEITVLVGGMNPHLASLREMAEGALRPAQLQVSPANVADWMAWADVAISAAGSTAWELAYMGVPSLLVVTADNQRHVAERLHAAEVAVSLGEAASLTAGAMIGALLDLLGNEACREQMATRGMHLIDGLGARRVVAAMAAHG